jgi:hypothetical protein
VLRPELDSSTRDVWFECLNVTEFASVARSCHHQDTRARVLIARPRAQVGARGRQSLPNREPRSWRGKDRSNGRAASSVSDATLEVASGLVLGTRC